jgi:type I restriction enzyme M protein
MFKSSEKSYMSSRNWDVDNGKESVILTPPSLCDFLYELVKDESFDTVWDIGCNTGNLSLPFHQAGHTTIGLDMEDTPYHAEFIEGDFFDTSLPMQVGDLVVCNPPFNDKDKLYGRKLLPELFLRRIFELGGSNLKVVFFAPMGLRLNQRKKSPRWRWMRDCGAELSSIVSLPIDGFDGVQFHMEVLLFNFENLNSHYFTTDTVWE